jgi:glycosyltransferase involved in cell wall biosynthesis
MSLCHQTNQDFEWIIVDDGSNDKSEEEIDKLNKKTHEFQIRFIYQKNGGKHRAINRGVREAKGELFLILDSDDTLPPTSLETILRYYSRIKDDDSYGGVAGYMAHHDGTIIGHCSKKGVVDANSLDYRYQYGATGDMCEVFKTSVLKEFPFPEIEGEKFVPEVLVWNRIAQKYKLRWFQEVIYYRDYLEGGLTDKIVKIRMKSPVASTKCYQELCTFNVPTKVKIRSAINYWRFRSCGSPHKFPHLPLRWLWTMPIGWVMHLNDLKKL